MSDLPISTPRAPISGGRLAAAGGIVGALTTLSTQLVEWGLSVTTVPENIQVTVVGFVGLAAGMLLVTVGSWGRDQIAAGNTGLLARIASLIGCVLFALWVTGCANFNRAGAMGLAATHGAATTITDEECAAFGQAATYMRAGPNRTLAFVWRGDKLERMETVLMKRKGQCETRANATPEVQAEAAGDFSKTWGQVEEVVR